MKPGLCCKSLFVKSYIICWKCLFNGRRELYFKYDAYLKLVDRIKNSNSQDAVDDLEALNDIMISFREYVNKVDAGEQ